jgi:hypothetical protein
MTREASFLFFLSIKKRNLVLESFQSAIDSARQIETG